MLTATAIIEEQVRIQGTGRKLGGLLAYPNTQAEGSALIVGPHPFLGGDMSNNVVNSLLKALASAGAVTLTFDYAGVGSSEGGPTDWPAVMSKFWKDSTFKEEEDWVDDTKSAMASLRQWCDLPPVLIGYSFGCYTLVHNLQEACVQAIVLISPNPKRHSFDQLSSCAAPLLVIYSDNDFTCDASEMDVWFESIREPKIRIMLPSSEHFFRGQETEVARAVLTFLKRHDGLGAELYVNDH